MSKGYTQSTPNSVKRRIHRKRTANRLKDLTVCVEFYYDNREDYTHSELNTLETVLANLRRHVHAVQL